MCLGCVRGHRFFKVERTPTCKRWECRICGLVAIVMNDTFVDESNYRLHPLNTIVKLTDVSLIPCLSSNRIKWRGGNEDHSSV